MSWLPRAALGAGWHVRCGNLNGGQRTAQSEKKNRVMAWGQEENAAWCCGDTAVWLLGPA